MNASIAIAAFPSSRPVKCGWNELAVKGAIRPVYKILSEMNLRLQRKVSGVMFFLAS